MKFTSFLTTVFLASTVLAHPTAEAEADYNLISRAIGSSCKAPEGTGKCAKTSSCNGITYNGLCPSDPADVKVFSPVPHLLTPLTTNLPSAALSSPAPPRRARASAAPDPATDAAAAPSSQTTARDLQILRAVSRVPVHQPHQGTHRPRRSQPTSARNTWSIPATPSSQSSQDSYTPFTAMRISLESTEREGHWTL